MTAANSTRARTRVLSTSNAARSTLLLLAGAVCLLAVSGSSTPRGKSPWVTFATVDGAAAYTPAASEAACRAAQADPAVICLSASDLRPVPARHPVVDVQIVAEAAIPNR